MSNREAVRKLLALLKDYTKIISIIFGCLLISTVLNLCVPLLSRRIMDDGFIGGNKELLIKLVLCSLMVYLVISVIDIIKEKNRINISAKNTIFSFLNMAFFTHLMKMKASYFNNKNYAEILNNINVDIGNMTSIADEGVIFCCYTSIQYDWRSHWVVYFELANDNFSFAVYSDKICSYEKNLQSNEKK